MKKKIAFFVALTLLVVMVATAFAATTGLTPYQTCPDCNEGIIGVYCGGLLTNNNPSHDVHEWTDEYGNEPYCNYEIYTAKTYLRCTVCDAENRGNDHTEYEVHPSCGKGSVGFCPF